MSPPTSTPRRGRPPLAWLDLPAITELPAGTVLAVVARGRNGARLYGRILEQQHRAIELRTRTGAVVVPHAAIERARIVDALYEPGDAVLRIDVAADDWRGGVVDADGEQVLVEQIDGSFTWIPETDLEPAEARKPALPPLPRGPIPSRVS